MHVECVTHNTACATAKSKCTIKGKGEAAKYGDELRRD